MVYGPSAGSGPFPLPGVGPPEEPSSRSRRTQGRYHRALRVTSRAHHATQALNSLWFSFTRRHLPQFSSDIAPQATDVSSAQMRMAAHIYDRCRRYDSRVSSDMCASIPLSFNVNGHYPVQSPEPSAGYSKTTVVVPIVADRVAIPDIAGEVDLIAALPPDVATTYSIPGHCLLTKPRSQGGTEPQIPRPNRPVVPHSSPIDSLPEPPKPRFFGSKTEYVKLITRLLSAGMVKLSTTQPLCEVGIFGTPKSDGKIRLIIDARATNDLFCDPDPVQLPTPDLFTRLNVPPRQPFYVAKCDLSDFFYRFRTPEWMHPYFGLPAVKAGLIGKSAEYGADTLVWPLFTVVPMGWSHSVLLTQQAHEHMLDTAPELHSLRRTERITNTSDFNVDRVRHAVYIDDVIFIGRNKSQVEAAQSAYVGVANARHLPVKPSKVVPPSADGIEGLGMVIHGREHTVGVSVDKLEKLCHDTYTLLRAGLASGRRVAELVGRWTWSMLVARPALSVFNAVYKYIETAGGRLFTLWPTVKIELWTAIRLAPLLVASLSSEWFPRVLACDASLDGQGVCYASAPPEAVARAAAHSGVPTDNQSPVESSINQPLLQSQWKTAVSAPWESPESINKLEVRAMSTALRWALSSSLSIRRRLLLLSDSQAAVGAITKGRTSSHPLLCRLRPVNALLLASGVQLFVRWIRSEDNPADAPSRRFSNHAAQA